MLKKYRDIILVLAIMLGTGLAYLTSEAGESTGPQSNLVVQPLTIQTRAGAQHNFNVEIADTPEKQATGMMFRKEMAKGSGMLFTMNGKGVLSFWMKNTLIPLDIIFIDQDGTIRKIHENAIPESLQSISSEVPVTGVLEIKGGQSQALSIGAGDKVVHPYFKP